MKHWVLIERCLHCRQAETLQQQVTDSRASVDQQKQSHQHTLTLLDQAHMNQLSKLQNELLGQTRDSSAADTILRTQLAEQMVLTQQLRHGMSELEHEIQALKKKSLEDQAVVKMLAKRQAGTEADSAAQALLDTLHDLASADDNVLSHEPDETPASASQPAVQTPNPFASNFSDKTLLLEADVLRREARVLRDRLAKAEADVQKLTQSRQEDERQSAAQLSKLEGMLSELEGKHLGSATLLDQTVAAMQSRTSILLQQRQSGKQIL